MHPDGFNIGYNLGSVAGVGIPNYIHCYIVPMWDGDTNITTIIAVVKVLPKASEHLASKLRKFFKNLYPDHPFFGMQKEKKNNFYSNRYRMLQFFSKQ